MGLKENSEKGSCCGGHGSHTHADHAAHGHAHHADHSHDAGHDHDGVTRVLDPVCGMTVDPATAKHRFAYKGQDYFFCSGRCRERFEAEPEKFLQPKSIAPAENVPEGAVYTCPMHPEVRQVGPGSCPICGMALEPEIISLDDKPDPELIDMTRRFLIALALTLPVVVIDMTAHLGGVHLLSPQMSNWLSFVLATPVVLWAGWPFFERGWRSLLTRNLNMFTLIAMGTGVAYVYSVIATLAPQVFPQAFRDMHGAVAVYFEAAAVITVLVLLGQVLELRARARTSGAIRALLGLAPKTARRIGIDADEDIDIDAIAVGVEVDSRGVAVADQQGGVGFVGVGEPVQFSEADGPVSALEVGEDAAGADRSELLVVADQAHPPTGSQRVADGGVQGGAALDAHAAFLCCRLTDWRTCAPATEASAAREGHGVLQRSEGWTGLLTRV